MAWELVAEGSGTDLNNVVSYEETEIAEGQKARLQCDCVVPVSTWQLDGLRNSLEWAGVEELGISGSGTRINITWRKGFPWAAVIILALVAVIVVAAWAFFKDVPVPVKTIAIAAGAVLVGIIAFNMIGGNNYGRQT